MIDLHLHLDGSLTAADIVFLAGLQKLPLPVQDAASISNRITAPPDCESLNDYLRCFDLTLTVLQSAEALSYAVNRLICRLAKNGMRYVEIRFAPQLHTVKGLLQQDAVQAAVNGMQDALQRHHSIEAGLILCFMRGGDNDECNRQTLDIANRFLSCGVCAVDLAGAEALYPTEQYRQLFAEVAAREIPFTIHAGEAAGPDSVQTALSFGAKRIGHGVRCVEDPALVRLLAQCGVTLELCPTSNLQTKAVPSILDFPVRELLKNGVNATINTDNMTVSGTDIAGEFRLLKTRLGLTAREENILLENAIAASFLSDGKKQTLMDSILPNHFKGMKD